MFNPDCAVAIYCGLKIHAVPPWRDCTILVLNRFMNMPPVQNRSNVAFRNGFLRLVMTPTAQSGFKVTFSENGSGLEIKVIYSIISFMARPQRIQFPGAVYHITSRGNALHFIFIDDH